MPQTRPTVTTSPSPPAAGTAAGKECLPLRRMEKNQSGAIAAVRASGELGLRIREMGLIPGTRITVLGRAPLQDPVALRVLGCTLSLRNNEADFIEVDVTDDTPPNTEKGA